MPQAEANSVMLTIYCYHLSCDMRSFKPIDLMNFPWMRFINRSHRTTFFRIRQLTGTFWHSLFVHMSEHFITSEQELVATSRLITDRVQRETVLDGSLPVFGRTASGAAPIFVFFAVPWYLSWYHGTEAFAISKVVLPFANSEILLAFSVTVISNLRPIIIK